MTRDCVDRPHANPLERGNARTKLPASCEFQPTLLGGDDLLASPWLHETTSAALVRPVSCGPLACGLLCVLPAERPQVSLRQLLAFVRRR